MAWVQLPKFPMEYVNTVLVKNIGNWLGKFIRMDAATTSLTRGRFARISVELDLSKPLQVEYKVNGRIKKVEYEGLHLICYECGKYGHKMENCPSKKEIEQSSNPTDDVLGDQNKHADTSSNSGDTNTKFGHWMQVMKGRKNRGDQPTKTENAKGKEVQTSKKVGNNFDVLRSKESQEVEDKELGTMVVYQPPNQSSLQSKSKKSEALELIETKSQFLLVGDNKEGDPMKLSKENHDKGKGGTGNKKLTLQGVSNQRKKANDRKMQREGKSAATLKISSDRPKFNNGNQGSVNGNLNHNLSRKGPDPKPPDVMMVDKNQDGQASTSLEEIAGAEGLIQQGGKVQVSLNPVFNLSSY
ncbi:uncharacterized protein LOC133292430 [Gastrolobium bilobum]|uniref:uncharacterized protein LOC133292430 n=1 Tax=Gastrolobium bilobum TaxID=150636 RepID=UPI002AB2EC14|nr:uncharacterized protein LOC133292430 [Gastrolobium bilobum]